MSDAMIEMPLVRLTDCEKRYGNYEKRLASRSQR